MSKTKGPGTPPLSGTKTEDTPEGAVALPAELPALIPDELRQEMVAKLGQQKVSLLEQTIMKISLYRSEWPPPDYIADAEAALPGSGQKIIDAVATKMETQNRIAERKANGAERRMDRGQLIGAATIAMGIGSATYIAGLPANFATLTIAVVAILACVGGPNVARVLADSLYLKRLKGPQDTELPPRDSKKRRR